MAAGGHLFGDAPQRPFTGPHPRSYTSKTCFCCLDTMRSGTPHRTCPKGHTTCAACALRLKRTDDCLLCNPLSACPRSPPSEERRLALPPTPPLPPLTLGRRCREYVLRQLRIAAHAVWMLVKLAFSVMASGYMGKLCIWMYVQISYDDYPAWFGWDNFRYFLLEAIGGALVALMLMGFYMPDP